MLIRSCGLSFCLSVAACASTSNPDVVDADAAVQDGTPDDRASTDGGVSETLYRISSGEVHSCAIAPDETLRCWGGNQGGQLGDGTTTNRATPITVPGVAGVTSVAAAGDGNTCALVRGGSVWCWGKNNHGQIGNGTTLMVPAAQNSPSLVQGLSSVVSISAGYFFECAILADRTVRCWGENDLGELGDGTLQDRSLPVQVLGLSGVASLGAGASHACAVLLDGSVWCWGANAGGELGDGTMTRRNMPVQVQGLRTRASRVMGGDSYSCALLVDGSAQCWGLNPNGQLGDGTTTASLVPRDVAGLTAVSLRAIDGVSCAIASDQSPRCWGLNRAGQIGDGTMIDRASPTPVSGLMLASAVAPGGIHACALDMAGRPWCWGSNDESSLGDGTTASRPTAAPVVWP